MAATWAEQLGRADFGDDANFFELGGDSLAALRVVSSLSRSGFILTLEEFYRDATVRAQAGALRARGGAFAGAAADDGSGPGGAGPAGAGVLTPLAPLQAALLVQALREGDLDPYWMVGAYRMPAGIGFDHAAAAWRAAVAANPALRTRLVIGPEGTGQVIAADVAAVLTEVREPDALSSDAFGQWCGERVRELAGRRLFNPGADPGAGLVAAWFVVHGGEPTPVFVLAVHHVLVDGWSLAQVLDDFMASLTGSAAGLTVRPSLAAYFGWLEETGARELARRYWRAALRDLEPAETLHFSLEAGAEAGRARPGMRCVSRRLTSQAAGDLAAFCAGARLTPAALATYQWARILAQYQDRDDICVGLTANIRPAGMPGSTELSGCLINVLPVRVSGDAGPAREPVAAVRELMTAMAAASRHGHLPYAEMTAIAGLPAASEMFASTVVFQNFAGSVDRVGRFPADEQAGAQVFEAGGTADPLCLTVDLGAEPCLYLEYDAARYEPEACEALLAALEYWLRHPREMSGRVAADGWITPAERKAAVLGGAGTQASLSVSAFLDAPDDATAIVDGTRLVSYARLRADVSAMAARLVDECGLRPGDRAAFVGSRGADVAVAMLAAWSAGIAWCGIDSALPRARQRQIVDQLRPASVVDLRARPARAVAGAPARPHAVFAPEQVAYYVSTSGSTGMPKLAALPAAGVAAVTEAWASAYFVPGRPERVLQIGSWTADIFLGDLLKALATGGTLVVCPDDKRVDMEYLAGLVHAHGITLVESTPALIAALMSRLRAGPGFPASLRTVIVGSDTFRLAEAAAMTAVVPPGIRLVNGYGLSECCIESLVQTCDGDLPGSPSGLCPIGSPLPGTRAEVVDGAGRPLPPGAVGELVVSGPQVGLGYLAGGTLRRSGGFAVSPAGGGRRYRTGDRAATDRRGFVHFYGRRDGQLKVRGYRVELGEVENALLRQHGITEACVLPFSRAGVSELRAFVGAAGGLDVGEVLAALRTILPAHAVPADVVAMARLPRTESGKVDRVTLAAAAGNPAGRAGGGKRHAAATGTPVNDLATVIAPVWEGVLGGPCGFDTGFFDAGGSSIALIVLHERLTSVLSLAAPGYEPTVSDLFRFPSINALAARAAAAAAAAGPAAPPAVADPGRGGVPGEDRGGARGEDETRTLLDAVARGDMSPAAALRRLKAGA